MLSNFFIMEQGIKVKHPFLTGRARVFCFGRVKRGIIVN